MPPKTTPNPKPNPLTTAGRLAKAAHKRDREMAGSTPPSPPPPKRKPRKTPVMPPPCEIEAEAALREEAKKAKKNKSKKPLTTKDKLAAADAAEAKKERAEKDPVGGGKNAKGKVKGEKPRNLMDIMRELGQMGSKSKTPAIGKAAEKAQAVAPKNRSDDVKGKTKAKAKESVLPRPKEKTKRVVDRQEHLLQDATERRAFPSSPPVKVEKDADGLSRASTRLMGLPPELRLRIWRFAVVETQCFIYPAVKHKQPDLAMTSRQIRSEVLTIFYGENTFAIEVPALTIFAHKEFTGSQLAIPLKLLQKWATVLATAGHVQRIRRWALLWKPLHGEYEIATGKSIAPADGEVIVSIRYPDSTAADLHDARPEVEIHRQAVCLLESHNLNAPCLIQCYPEWLDDIIDVAGQQEGDRGKQMILVANSFKAGILAHIRCREESGHL